MRRASASTDDTRPIGLRRGSKSEPPVSNASSDEEPRTEELTDSRLDVVSESSSPVAPALSAPKEGAREPKSASDMTHAQRKLEGMRILLGAILLFALMGIAGVAVFPGAEPHGLVLAISFGTIAASTLPMFVRAMRAKEYRFDRYLIAHTFIVSATVPGVTFGLGMNSAVSGVFALGIMFFALNGPRRVVLVSYLEIAVGHAFLSTLAFFDVIPSTGFRIPVSLHSIDLVLASLWVEGEYGAALGIGLLLNARWRQMIDQLERAVRAASARDALLREVRAEFDRAANLLGPGRFTGHELGSYRLDEVIGRGGMGEVYAAKNLVDGSEAAVKVLLRGMLAERDVVARFQREARTVKLLATPYVTEVFEVGSDDAEIPYIAMERLHGQDLAAELRAKETLPLDELRTMIREVASGLEVAHEAGIVHRDLKPNNLFHAEVSGGRIWKILDFGVAKDTARDEATLTFDQILGTPQYMAPEQALRERVVDRRTDVHALSVISYRAITGRLPWTSGDVTRVLLAVATEIPVDPTQYVDLPNDLALVLRIGLAKRPDDRFPTASELAAALDAAIDGRLAPRWRDHGAALLAAEPWGSTSRGPL